MNEVMKRQNQPRDNFDYDPLIEYAGSGGKDRPVRSMQGETKLKFVDPDWTADGVPCNDRVLVCYDRNYAAVHWGDGAPIEVRVLARGEPAPNLKALNAAIPKEQWRDGFNGQPEPPWQLQRVLEFLDPETAERLSWPANVTVAGSSRAAEELEGRIKIVRRLRGEDVYPRVRLVCRERSIVRGDRGRVVIAQPPSRPEARRRLGYQTASELGAPVDSSIPEQLLGHEPASARMGYEDGHALFLRYRRVEGLLGRGGAA